MPSAPSNQSPSASSSGSDVNGSNDNYSNISELENQIKVLDERIKENREQAAQLARQRSKTYAQNQRDMRYGTKRPKNADITKNDPYSSARRRAKATAAAGAKSRDKLRSIDSQLKSLDAQWKQLAQQRNEIDKELRLRLGSASENAKKKKSQKTDSDALIAKNNEEIAKNEYFIRHYKTQQLILDKIADNIRNGVFTGDEIDREIEKAKNIQKNFKEKTGMDLYFPY